MMSSEFSLEEIYFPADSPKDASWILRLHALGGHEMSDPIFNFTSQTLIDDETIIVGAKLLRVFGNTVWLAPLENVWDSRQVWEIEIRGLKRVPMNFSHGVMEAKIWHGDAASPVSLSGLQTPNPEFNAHVKLQKKPYNYLILPHPQLSALAGDAIVLPIALTPNADEISKRAVASVAGLAKRLHPTISSPFHLDAQSEHFELFIHNDNSIISEGYHILFERNEIHLRYRDESGLHHGLVTLAQLHYGAQKGLSFPLSGEVTDAPKYLWRGLHFDVSRHYFDANTISQLIDIMAWLKLNRLHWHLTDDEGWRLPSRAFPKLNEFASWRGPNQAIAAQYSHLDEGYGGFYTAKEIQALIAKAEALHIKIMPELDWPGHSTALLAAMPELADAQEPQASYHSVQGYPNNALNPANEKIYPILETLLDEVMELFPFEYIHIGGDEVDAQSWAQSPLAKGRKQAEWQNTFTHKLHKFLTSRGRKTATWDECGEGDALDPARSLLFAWRSEENVKTLLAKGYQVVATPGQYYYLDMQAENGWDGFGATWAGIVDLRKVYEYEPPEGVLGIQAGIWTEALKTPAHLNAMVFPRLYAIAERAWSLSEDQSLERLMTNADYLPQF